MTGIQIEFRTDQSALNEALEFLRRNVEVIGASPELEARLHRMARERSAAISYEHPAVSVDGVLTRATLVIEPSYTLLELMADVARAGGH